MDAIELLRSYKKRFDPFLAEYFSNKKNSLSKDDLLANKSIDIVQNFTLSGGKRVRPALFYYAYLACGGEDGEEIIKASMSSELLHTALLVHDDIIDRDDLRHGVETVHVSYKKDALQMSSQTDPAHFGNSMAICVGDAILSMANEIVCKCDFPQDSVIKALSKLQETLFTVISGEMLDVSLEAKGAAMEKEVMQMYDWKTASYTFEGPIHLGAILAGADESMLEKLSSYAIPAGMAFQIRDDILGIFADEEKLGKPVGSDIIEGKQTILVVKVLENGSEDEKKKFLEILNQGSATQQDIEDFREIVKNTGALKYAEKISEELIEEALEELSKIEMQNDDAKAFFEGIAKYIIKRKY